MSRAALFIVPVIVAVYTPMCPAEVRPTLPAAEAPIAQLWQPPLDVSTRDLYYGPWGPESAPDAHATYTLVDEKTHGFNPGVVVTDSEGRRWHVKQAPPFNEPCAEGPAEVLLSRVLATARRPTSSLSTASNRASGSGPRGMCRSSWCRSRARSLRK